MKHVFLHGLGQDPASWDEVVRAMGLGDEALRPGLLGWLRGREIAYSNLYKALEEYCGTLDRPLNLCGLSLGAVLALQYAQEHPASVKSLVLIGGRVRTPKTLLKVQNILFHLMGEKNFREMGLSKADAIALMGTMGELDLRGGLGRVTCPTLVLCGEKDSANRKDAQTMAAGIPGAGFAVIPGAGHEVNRDAPEALAEVLEPFYGTLEKGRKI